MADQDKQSAQAAPFKEAERIRDTGQLLADSAAKLAKFGGFDLIEAVIEGARNMNPDKKALKKIFLSDADRKSERQALKKTLQIWANVFSESQTLPEMVEKSEAKAKNSETTLKSNLLKALDATRDIERSYRSVALFYKNTESDKVKNVSIMNADPDQLKDLDNTRFYDKVAEVLKQNYDRLDLRDNYSILCIPGYLGSNKVFEKWAKLAYQNKVMMVTDFAHLDAPDDVMSLFASANLTGGDIFRSNAMMTCNWLVGRGKAVEVGEADDLYIPPSGALAGKMYQTLMSQVAAGKKHGGMNEVDGVRFELKKSEISNLDKIGLIPMVNAYGKVMAFSSKTLFSGDNIGLQTYSVVRVFDYVTKVLVDFLNRVAFQNWTTTLERDLKATITKFLDGITGPDQLIENFKIMKFVQDRVNKDRIYLDIHLTPYFPAKTFMIKLDGQKGQDAATTWGTEYAKT